LPKENSSNEWRQMDNEIKFIFTGDTSDYDNAVDDVVKKANKTKLAEEKTNSARMTAVKLQKLLAEEYKDAAKAGGDVAEIEDRIKKTEQERVNINKQLNDQLLTRERRQELILERAKAEARIRGFRTARAGARAKGVGDIGGQALSVAGLGGTAGAAFSAMSAGIALPAIAAFATVGAALAGLTATVRGTSAAMQENLELRKAAQKEGKSVEQLQIEQFVEKYGGNAEEIGSALKAFGVIVDEDLNRRLAESSKAIGIVGDQLFTKLIPIFTTLAEVTAKAVASLGGFVAGLDASFKPGGGKTFAAGLLTFFGSPALGSSLMGSALGGFDKSKFGPAYEDFINNLFDFAASDFMKAGQAKGATALQPTADALTRIGLFKGQRDSELQTMKAQLEQQRRIATNTGQPLIQAIENA
jgi:hypothetical protein